MIIGAKNVNKFYKKEQVLKNVTMALDEGEILGIVGESGCGKSTLARHLCLYEKPTSGEIIYRNQNASGFSKEEKKSFRRDCQMILQDNLGSLDPTMTIGDSLREVLKYNSTLSKNQIEEKMEEFLEKVFLSTNVVEKRPAQLSGGERQRVNIARALLIGPKVLICDEITSSLDVITQYHIMELLLELREKLNLSIIFISHDIKSVENVSDRILVMHQGEICEELKKTDGFVYSHPYTEDLLNSLPISHPSKRTAIELI